MGKALTLEIETGEGWFGGASFLGDKMPFGAAPLELSLVGLNHGNQAVPLLISTTGRWIWSESPLTFRFEGGKIEASSTAGDVLHGRAGKTLREAFQHASRAFFPANGKLPEPLLFSKPQYNTWIELMYDQNEDAILRYANDLVKNGFPPGVFMIDDTWQENYGVWEFAPRRFRDPKGMIAKLHAMGFKVMLWICPFVSADSVEYRDLAKKGLLLMEGGKVNDVLWANTTNSPAIIRWWNGASAVLDLSNPGAHAWFKGRLDYLQNAFGVDGFKFDAGDTPFYEGPYTSFGKVDSNTQTELFAKMGLDYPLNELRASWKCGGQPIVQRLRDKRHAWPDLELLVPHMIALGLMGHPFSCPDLIGGGEYQSFLDGAVIDEELVVRSAQCSALMPMMQFSAAPWRVLSKANSALCLEMAKLHESFGAEILRLAEACAKSGEPMVRSLEYLHPGKGYASVKDQYLLGDDVLVAPVTTKGSVRREILFPEGTWQGACGTFTGPVKASVEAPLSVLPWFRRV